MGFLVGMEPAFRVGARRTATPSLQAGSWNLLSVWRLSAQLWAPLASAAVICLLSDSATQLRGGGFPGKHSAGSFRSGWHGGGLVPGQSCVKVFATHFTNHPWYLHISFCVQN